MEWIIAAGLLFLAVAAFVFWRFRKQPVFDDDTRGPDGRPGGGWID
jgi:LPXTG-motif cell wall-anchored protein